MKTSFVRRGRLEIVYEILSVCCRPVQKTRIIYTCNLNHGQLHKYLKYLISCGLLRSIEKNRREFFLTTGEGKGFLKEYERLKKFVNKNHRGMEGLGDETDIADTRT